MQKIKKYDTYCRKTGTYHKAESMTDKSSAQETDIYYCLKKYGTQSLLNI